MSRLITLILLALLLAGSLSGASGPVTISQDKSITLDNGLIRMELSPEGQLTGLHLRGGPNLASQGYWNANANAYGEDGPPPRHRFIVPKGKARIVRHSENLVDIAFDRKPEGVLPFGASLHYVLRREEPGFYLYMTLSHKADMPPGFIVQYAYNLRLDPAAFHYIAVDETRRHISHRPRDEAAGEQIMDATFRLKGGRVVSKYDYTHAIEDEAFHLYGWAGPQAGVWWIQPSAEYYGSTPFRVLLTSHQTTKSPIIIWQAHCTHRGGYRIDFPPGDNVRWEKLYGPVFVYVNNGNNYDAMWQDANDRLAVQQKAWPYDWMRQDLFPIRRGKVTGTLMFEEGQPVCNAWVILSPEGTHWSEENRGYHFWGRTNDRGQFHIPNVRPGTYSLYAVGADQFYEFKRDGLVIEGAKENHTGELHWNRVLHGKHIWQVGIADRSTGEFTNGRDFHHWGLWRRYPVDFPHDVHFVIGKSRETVDWNFAHWNWYSRRNAWEIIFILKDQPRGTGILTFGIAGARGHGPDGSGSNDETASLNILVNGSAAGSFEVPSTGGDSYRSQRQSTRYTVKEVRFDAGLLRQGKNTLTLRHARAEPYKTGETKGEKGSGPGCIMYDAIRFELLDATPQKQST